MRLPLYQTAKIGKQMLRKILTQNVPSCRESSKFQRLSKNALKLYLFLHFLPVSGKNGMIGTVSLNVVARYLRINHQTARCAMQSLVEMGCITAVPVDTSSPYLYQIGIVGYQYLTQKKQAGYITLSRNEVELLFAMRSVNALRYSLYATLSMDDTAPMESSGTIHVSNIFSKFLNGRRLQRATNTMLVVSERMEIDPELKNDRRRKGSVFSCRLLYRHTENAIQKSLQVIEMAKKETLNLTEMPLVRRARISGERLKAVFLNLAEKFEVPDIAWMLKKILCQYAKSPQKIENLEGLLSHLLQNHLSAAVAGEVEISLT